MPRSTTWLLLCLILLPPLAKADSRTDQAAEPPVVVQVADRIRDKVPPSHLTVYRDFARQTLSAMTNFQAPPAAAEEDGIVRSIVQVALDFNRHADKLSEDQLRQRLQQFLDSHRKNLQAITPPMLHADWQAARNGIERDEKAVQKEVADVFAAHPVVVLDVVVIMAVLTGRDSVEPKDVGSLLSTPAASRTAVSATEASNRCQALVAKAIGDAVHNAFRPVAETLDNIYFMSELRYAGPLDEKGKEDIHRYVESTFLFEKVAVLPSLGSLFEVIANIRARVLGAPLPPPEEAAVRKTRILKVFEGLWNLSRVPAGPKVFPPLSYGGPVPDAMSQGSFFGFMPRATSELRVPTSPEMTEMNQLVNFWLSCIARKVKGPDSLADEMLWSFFEQWKSKIYSLQDFFGTKTDQDLTLSPPEQALLALLRKDRRENPLFVKKDLPREDRIRQFEAFFFRRPLLPQHEAYLELADTLQKWLDEKYKASVTPEMAHAEALATRTVALFDFLLADIAASNRLTYKDKQYAELSGRWHKSWKKLKEAGAFAAAGTLSKESMSVLSPEDKALYEYFNQARKHNPVLADCQQPLPKQTLLERYQAYAAKGRPQEEQRAYDTAAEALTGRVLKK